MSETSNIFTDYYNPSFFKAIGCASALVLANLGAAYGTGRSGIGICVMGVLKPDKIIKSVIPVIMAGILGIYGLIVSIIINQNNCKNYKESYSYLAAGLCCGLCSLGAGLAIGIGGDAGVRALGQNDRVFVGMMLILIFSEALGLYGMIIALILSTSK